MPKTSFPGVIVPAFVTAPITVEPVITIEVVEWFTGLVTVATVWFVIVCPACAGAARSSAASEVEARSAGGRAFLGARFSIGSNEKTGTRIPLFFAQAPSRRF
ncbi:MAG: hypothetical protein JOY67_22985 [Hyphomicrobiales bacterium]|nr:hypothetical protein [Hyphomicrobiales bacterium]